MQTPTLEEILIDQLHPSPFNPRKDEGDISELQASILRSGMTNPMIVRSNPDADNPLYFEVLAGSRRRRAAIALGMATVSCLVYDGLSDDDARDLAITDNLQRADIHPMEEAEAYRALMAAHAATAKLAPALPPAAIAARVGKTEAYVATRLRLLDLHFIAKEIFAGGHLTLGHALILARLTQRDQERALDFMLERDPRQTKETLPDMVNRRLQALKRDKGVDYRGRPNATRGRLIEATEAQLKKWVETSVLLILKGVPWDLADEALVPAAGACVTCPKRTGASPALFTEFTAQEDVCTDGACFGAKQDAVIRRYRDAVKDQGEKLLKLSAKESNLELEEPAVVDGKVVTSKAMKAGQWLKAVKPCANTISGIMTDGPDKGKIVKACADQKCKVHKHTVRKPGQSSYQVQAVDPVKAKAEAEKREAWAKAEVPIRSLVFKAITAKALLKEGEILRVLVGDAIAEWHAPAAAVILGVTFKTTGDTWQVRRFAVDALKDAVSRADWTKLIEMGFVLLFAGKAEVNENSYRNPKQDRGDLWKLAAKYKVDADAIAAKVSIAQEPVVKPGKPAVKPLKKQAAKAKASGKKR